MIYSDPDLPKKIRRLAPKIWVLAKRRNAYAERKGSFWRVYSDPNVPKSQSLMGSALRAKDAWLKALITIEHEYEQ